jgi:hypothetical protein
LISSRSGKSSSDSDINRIMLLEGDLKKESPLNAYHVEDKSFLLKAFEEYSEVKNDNMAKEALITSIRTSIPFDDLYKSIRDFDTSAEKLRFLDSFEKLTDRVLEKKGVDYAKKASLNAIKAFKKVKDDPVARDVFEASMKTGADFKDLYKTIKIVDGEELRRGVVKNFEDLRKNVLKVFPEEVAEKLNAKSIIQLGSDLQEKEVVEKLGKNPRLKRFFILTRGLGSTLPFKSVLGLESVQYPFIKTDHFVKLHDLSGKYDIPFKKLVKAYGRDKTWLKRNLNLVWSDIKPGGLKPEAYADLMQELRGLKVKDVETGWVAFNRGVKPRDYAEIEREAGSVKIHPFVLVEAASKLKKSSEAKRV